ncbi:hypothetical protein C5167_018535 [Papaver somniferum]|uniref:Uncharacterized protein n=1 Tax=Papaver somniferum TaxID=3469 RepID=A0A4Y7IRJ0_PAPSO|nr:hypothetical protein C5167_018535 [Papaver somniferum]
MVVMWFGVLKRSKKPKKIVLKSFVFCRTYCLCWVPDPSSSNNWSSTTRSRPMKKMSIWIFFVRVGLFETQLSSSSFQADEMSNPRFLPGIFSGRSKKFTIPWVRILLSSTISLGIIFINFDNIIAAVDFLYSMSMLLEFRCLFSCESKNLIYIDLIKFQ